MTLRRVELVRVDLPLVRPFQTSYGTETHRDVLLVHMETDGGDGWGEVAAQAGPFYNEEFVDASAMVIERFAVPTLAAADHLTAADVGPALARIKGYPAAKAGLEMALLDAELRASGTRLADHLGGVRDAVDVGVSVGMTGSVAALVDVVAGHVDEGYRRVKLKIEPGFDTEPVGAVRDAFPDLPLQVDANASYGPSDIDHVCALDAFGLLMVEQPFAADDLATHAALARQMATPVCLDESITSARAAAAAIDAGACSIVNLKVARVGGLLACASLHDLCRERSVPVWCGGMLESGVGRAANIALATLPGFTYPGDISATSRYFHRDVTEPFELTGSQLTVPTGPGLGITVDEDALVELGGTRRDVLAPD